MPTNKQDLENLTKLGGSGKAERMLEVFPNHLPRRQVGVPSEEMEVSLHCTEFTCRCPLTGQPDYAVIDIIYTPDKFVVESKSMKLYLETYREEGVFHEHLAVDIGKDFVKYVKPLACEVVVSFNTRGGIAIDASWRYKK